MLAYVTKFISVSRSFQWGDLENICMHVSIYFFKRKFIMNFLIEIQDYRLFGLTNFYMFMPPLFSSLKKKPNWFSRIFSNAIHCFIPLFSTISTPPQMCDYWKNFYDSFVFVYKVQYTRDILSNSCGLKSLKGRGLATKWIYNQIYLSYFVFDF